MKRVYWRHINSVHNVSIFTRVPDDTVTHRNGITLTIRYYKGFVHWITGNLQYPHIIYIALRWLSISVIYKMYKRDFCPMCSMHIWNLVSLTANEGSLNIVDLSVTHLSRILLLIHLFKLIIAVYITVVDLRWSDLILFIFHSIVCRFINIIFPVLWSVLLLRETRTQQTYPVASIRNELLHSLMILFNRFY